MTNPQCQKFDTCSSPLCPSDEQSLQSGIWIPYEEICNLKSNAKLLWVRVQKKIARVGAREGQYFKLAMLERNCVIRKGIDGFDPDDSTEDEELRVKKWLEKHPKKRILSQEEKSQIIERLTRKNNALETGVETKKIPPSLAFFEGDFGNR